jgi:hypothetical protein
MVSAVPRKTLIRIDLHRGTTPQVFENLLNASLNGMVARARCRP